MFSPRIASGIVLITDVISLLLPGIVIYLFYVSRPSTQLDPYLATMLMWTVAVLAVFYVAGMYNFEMLSALSHQLTRVVRICCTIILLMAVLAFALRVSSQFSRIWVFSYFALSTASICVSRGFLQSIVYKYARTGRLTRNIAILGGGEQARRLLSSMQRANHPWNRVVGIFDDRLSRIGDEVMGYPVLGGLDELVSAVRDSRIDDVIVALPWNADRRITSITERLSQLPVHIRLGVDLIGFTYPTFHQSRIGGILMLDIVHKPISDWHVVAKLAQDKLLASFLILLTLPLMILIAIAIKLDSSGPVVFRQSRFGFNNQRFKVLKFRTMYHNRPDQRDASVRQAQKDDPRVTRVGRFLRRTSLDELPQLFNVLQGSMSLVGPRPHADAHNEEFAALVDGYFSRHRVRPGITGWAQVNGLRGENDEPGKIQARVEHDLYYIENWSTLFDLQILIRTAFVVWGQETAY